MTDPLTYTPPARLRKPFTKGQLVEVCDRELKPISMRRIIRVGVNVVHTDDDREQRRWRAADGWWLPGSTAYPFPSIRPAKLKKRFFTAGGRYIIAESYSQAKRIVLEEFGRPRQVTEVTPSQLVTLQTGYDEHPTDTRYAAEWAMFMKVGIIPEDTL